ncbi:MAG: right-handed parallel beta-helix repeat-containing protein [Verrucomicrobiales bacterium]|nr:right-handed parallel beta-helix repeat-containing protein [Verrucomicrobiales bacterium]
MRVLVRWLPVVLMTMVPFLQPSHAATFNVSPTGDDAGEGTADRPFRTVAAAVSKARGTPGPHTIQLANGRYELAETLRLEPADSGLTLEAAIGAQPVLSGGRRLVGWVRDASVEGLWKVTLPEVRAGQWYFQQLFADGRRLQRARTPNEGFFRTTAALGTNTPIALPFHAGDLREAWTQWPRARLIMLMKWTDLQVPIRAVDPSKSVASLPGGPRPYWMSEGDARYWVENVPDAMDQPGEWFLDERSGVLSLLAPSGMDPNQSVVVAPRLQTLVTIAGDPKSQTPVHRLFLRRLSFVESDYEAPLDGMISPQAAVPIRGALRVQHSVQVSFEECTFRNLGGYAVEFGRGARRCRIYRCSVNEVGGGAVRLGEMDDRTPDDFSACRGHEILDSRFVGLGRIFTPAVGVLVLQSGGNRIAHNEIADLYYTAISVGWNWGYQETPCRENVIEFNHLHHIGQGRLSDMGGVYTLGIQHGTIVRNNLVHDIESYDYGGWGLYTDEGSTGILLENNVVYRCKSAGFHQHYGRDNVVRNNIFAFNRENQLMRTRDEDHRSFTFTNNIVYFDSGKLLGSSWKNNQYLIDHNIYFDARVGADAARMTLDGGSWAQWQARGHDQRSIVADPLFKDATRFDFSLQPQSPALAHGFRPIAIANVGPRSK